VHDDRAVTELKFQPSGSDCGLRMRDHAAIGIPCDDEPARHDVVRVGEVHAVPQSIEGVARSSDTRAQSGCVLLSHAMGGVLDGG
jgi:hypothetical protein